VLAGRTWKTDESQLTSHFESSTYGFYAASGSAALLATLVFVYGIRVLRRVRRVALTGKTPRRGLVLFGRAPTMEPTPPWEAQLEDHFRCNDPITGAPWAQPEALKAQGALRRKLAIWDWILRRKGHVPGSPGDPVWINRAADMARARDAMQGERLQQAEQGDQERRGWDKQGWEDRMKAVEKIRAGRMKAWEKGEWEPGWETASWKWGRGKPKWAKE
jgi:magnesium transporter